MLRSYRRPQATIDTTLQSSTRTTTTPRRIPKVIGFDQEIAHLGIAYGLARLVGLTIMLLLKQVVLLAFQRVGLVLYGC